MRSTLQRIALSIVRGFVHRVLEHELRSIHDRLSRVEARIDEVERQLGMLPLRRSSSWT